MARTKTQPSAKDLLTSLTAGKKTKLPTTQARPEMELPPNLAEAFARLGGADALEELVEARIKQAKELLNDGCFRLWTESLWKQKTQPANPQLKVEKDGQPDIEGIYMVVQWYSLNVSKKPGDNTLEEIVADDLAKLFIATGMTEEQANDVATRLVTTEMVLTPKPIIDLDKLVNGHYEGEGKNKNFVEASPQEQAIASKLIQMIQARSNEDLKAVGCFTDDEANTLVEYKAQVVVKKGFLQRVCSYVNSLDQLRMIFTVVQPKRYPQVKKFAASDTAEARNRRLLGVAYDILGIVP